MWPLLLLGGLLGGTATGTATYYTKGYFDKKQNEINNNFTELCTLLRTHDDGNKKDLSDYINYDANNHYKEYFNFPKTNEFILQMSPENKKRYVQLTNFARNYFNENRNMQYKYKWYKYKLYENDKQQDVDYEYKQTIIAKQRESKRITIEPEKTISDLEIKPFSPQTKEIKIAPIKPLQLIPLPDFDEIVAKYEDPREEINTYVVRDGDTLSSIAKKHGLTYQELAEKNNIKISKKLINGKYIDYAHIIPDQEILI